MVTRLQKLGLFAGVSVLFTSGFYAFQAVHHPEDDFGSHIAYAATIHRLSDIRSPHFLFQLLLNAVHATGLSYEMAAAWILGLCYGGMALLIVRECERRGISLTPRHLFGTIPAVLLAAHIFLPTLGQHNVYYGYFVPIAWHNPTQQLNKLFGLWIYFLYVSEFVDSDRARARSLWAMVPLVLLSAVAKPSFLVAFVPAAGVFLAVDIWRRRWRQVSAAFILTAVAGAVLLWQARGGFDAAAATGVVFAPFTVFDLRPTLYKLPASLAFPIVVGVIAVRRGAFDARWWFLAVFTAVALLVTLLLSEAGPRASHGNLAWTGQTAVFLTYVEAVLFILARPAIDRRWRLAWSMFAVHVACGLFWFYLVFNPKRTTWL